MKVLKLTNSAVPGPKPKFFITAAIHAREYTTAELVTRFAESLVNGYGTDADATWILDNHEIHIMLHTNPDGRKQAETGSIVAQEHQPELLRRHQHLAWRRPQPQLRLPVGLLRRIERHPVRLTYRGPSPASEPEVQAVQTTCGPSSRTSAPIR